MGMAWTDRIRCHPVTSKSGKRCSPKGNTRIRFISLALDKVSTLAESVLSIADAKHGASLMSSVYHSSNLTVHQRSR